MASALAHEISQPMTAARALARSAQYLLQPPEPDLTRARENLSTLVGQIDHAAGVVRRMREFLRRGQPHFSTLDVGAVLEDALVLARPDAAAHHTRIDLAVEPALPTVFGDRIQLQQVVLNLLMNACEAVRAVDVSRRQVRLTTAAEEGRVVVSVSDCGIGFAGDQIDRMFEPFFTTTAEGMGLGLSICRTIIDAHGGLISARPNPDNGLTCWFSLAALAPVEEALAQRPSPLLRSKTWT
jgi:two-component system, LuxR family, sensor kinase FixL